MIRFVATLFVTLACACETNSVYGSVGGHSSSGHSAATSGAASSTSSSTTGGSGSSGTTAGMGSTATSTSGSGTGTSSGTTSGTGTRLVCANEALMDCAPGQVELLAQVVDYLTDLPLSMPVQVQDVLDNTADPVSGANGLAYFCFAPGTVVSTKVQVTGYTTMIFSDILLETSDRVGHLPLYSNDAWSYVEQELGSIDTSKSEVVVSVNRGLSNPPPYCTQDGWAFHLTDLDGGGVPAPVAYISGTSISPNQWTGSSGIAVFYDVDPAVGAVRVIGAQIDAGLRCGQAAEEQYTGTVQLLPNGVVSDLEFIIVDAGP